MTVILVVAFLSFLILIHEWGHFYTARKLKIKVEEFGFGFPPRIYSIFKNGVRYSINLLPIGGFVRIFGEQGEGGEDPNSFASRPAWQRIAVLTAGVVMNLLAAWMLFNLGLIGGIPELSTQGEYKDLVSIVGVMPNSPASSAGMKIGDIITSISSTQKDSIKIKKTEEVIDFIYKHKGEPITIGIKRQNQVLFFNVIPRKEVKANEGPVGIMLEQGRLITKRVPVYLIPWEGLKFVWQTSKAILLYFANFITGAAPIAVSGPVGIYFIAKDMHQLGFYFFMHFLGVLGVSLAILNLLPFPALDGGRIIFVLIEKIRGSRVDIKIEKAIHTLGFVLLLLLMIIITYRDIAIFF